MKKIRNDPLDTPRALRTMERVVAALRELGSASKKDVAKHLGMSDTHAGVYLRRLDKAGRVECVAQPQCTREGWMAAVWCLTGEAEQAEVTERTVVLARAGNVGMRRDPLVAALFGAAGQVA